MQTVLLCSVFKLNNKNVNTLIDREFVFTIVLCRRRRRPNCLSSLIGTLRNEDGSKDDGSCEKYYFSFSFFVLDHR